MKKIDWKSKKTIIIIVVAVVLVLALLSVGIITFGNYREAAEVQDLKEKIAAFPDVDDLTAEDSDALSELIEAYNALSDEEKSELAEESAKLQNASNKIEQITGTKPDVTMPAEENTTSENTTVSGGTDSGTTSKPSGGSSSGSAFRWRFFWLRYNFQTVYWRRFHVKAGNNDFETRNNPAG